MNIKHRFHTDKQKLSWMLAFVLLLSLGACNKKQDKQTKVIKRDAKTIVVGLPQNPTYTELFEKGIKPGLEKKGYKIVERTLTDLRTFNSLVGTKEVDINVGQHKGALDFSESRDKQNLSPLITIPSAIYGIYSKNLKAKNLEELKKEIKKGDKVSVPNDPSNLSRSLIFLENLGLIKLKAGPDKRFATDKDIVSNPYGLDIRPIEGPQVSRSLESVAFGLVSGAEAIYADIFDSCIVKEVNTDDYYLIIFAVRTADLNAQWAKDFVEVVQSEEFKNVVENKQYIFHKYYRPAWYVKKWKINN
ncbi:MAG: MetQ/NlpA family ABC transporter substrate-binding protein [Paludibacteraceae bacterium]|nr:MetQ/NlpA family ABC transporter substrate-binding protein [Paludibacteraceae bacterium]